MLNEFLGRAMHWRVLALRLLDHFTDHRLKLEQHYCPAKISEGHPNPLKISMITHGRSENDFN
jgi:hypothetical protein